MKRSAYAALRKIRKLNINQSAALNKKYPQAFVSLVKINYVTQHSHQPSQYGFKSALIDMILNNCPFVINICKIGRDKYVGNKGYQDGT